MGLKTAGRIPLEVAVSFRGLLLTGQTERIFYLSAILLFYTSCSTNETSSVTKVEDAAAVPPNFNKVCFGDVRFYSNRDFAEQIDAPVYLSGAADTIKSWSKRKLEEKDFEIVERGAADQALRADFDLNVVLGLFRPTIYARIRVYFQEELLFEIYAVATCRSYHKDDINESAERLADNLVGIFTKKVRK